MRTIAKGLYVITERNGTEYFYRLHRNYRVFTVYRNHIGPDTIVARFTITGVRSDIVDFMLFDLSLKKSVVSSMLFDKSIPVIGVGNVTNSYQDIKNVFTRIRSEQTNIETINPPY